MVATTGMSAYLDRLSYRALQWVVFICVALHNLEEGLAAIVLGGYAPGVGTAVLLNLPISLYFRRRSLREGYVTRRAASLAAR